MAVTWWIVLKTFIILGGFVLAVSLLQFFMSIHPPRYYSPDAPDKYGLKYENVSFITSDKINIKAWLVSSEKANGTVIIGHGYPFDKGNILPVVKFLYPDYNLLLYDHRYFGKSSGSISTVGIKEVEDVKAALDFVHKRFGKQPVALYGFSLSASAMLMAKTKVNAIIADSAYADLENIIKDIYKTFGPFKFPFVKTTNLISMIFFKVHPRMVSPALAIKDSDIPILVIHGEKDSQIPVENAYLLKESNSNIELWVAKESDHGEAYALYKNEYEERIKNFLKHSFQSYTR
ncbi:MAG: alpha/beta hydrolase [Nanoarchaeota archaeon]|nr:alpha/beta hydrolase [Nanoarchaeota archaeon]